VVAALGLPVAAVGIALKAWQSDLADDVKRFVVVAAAVFVLLEIPTVVAAYFSARDACRSGTAAATECIGLPGV
jgi:hypothetical protein